MLLGFELYAWNARLAAAFHEVLGHTEVAVRNAIDIQLRQWNKQQSDNPRNPENFFTEEWLFQTAIPIRGLISDSVKKVRSSADRAMGYRPVTHTRKHAEITHDDVAAQLSFGTWNRLIPLPNSAPSTQHLLWNEAIQFAFPNIKNGHEGSRQVKSPLNVLHRLRNRVAHHEPLLHVEANCRVLDIARLTGYVDQDIADWIMAQQRVREIVRERPKPKTML